MTQPPVRETCPIDLHYPEPGAVDLDLSSIVGHGRRIRRRQRLTRAAAAIAACAAVASISAGLRGATFAWFPSRSPSPASRAVTPIDPFVALSPPVNEKLTLLSSWPGGWTTVAWATRHGDVCWATYAPAGPGDKSHGCWSPADIPGQGGNGFSPLLPTAVVFPVNLVPEFGLVTPRATRVVVTFFGHPFRAGVVQVPMSGGKTIGVYMIWLHVPASAHSYGSGDVGGVIAYDRAGRIVARHGPGM